VCLFDHESCLFVRKDTTLLNPPRCSERIRVVRSNSVARQRPLGTPRVECRGFTTSARCNKHAFSASSFRSFVLEFVISPKYSGIRIIVIDSKSHRLTSEDPKYTLCVCQVSTSGFEPSPLHPRTAMDLEFFSFFLGYRRPNLITGLRP